MIAQMFSDGDHMGDGWWWVMGIGWLVVVALIVVTVVVLVRHLGPGPASRRDAEAVLAERFARGELDADEYRTRRDVLRNR